MGTAGRGGGGENKKTFNIRGALRDTFFLCLFSKEKSTQADGALTAKEAGLTTRAPGSQGGPPSFTTTRIKLHAPVLSFSFDATIYSIGDKRD
jgi:hypothetical protein